MWEAVKQEGKLCDDVETVREYTCLGDKVRAGGRCKAAVIARTRFWWIRLRECGELLYYRRFSLWQNWAVYKSYLRPAVLYGSEALCLKESDMGILQRTERSMVSAMCGVQLKDRRRSTKMMFMLGLSETIDQLAMENSVRWYGYVLRRWDGHVLMRALDLEVGVQRKKERQ